jgi:hypothetical protein
MAMAIGDGPRRGGGAARAAAAAAADSGDPDLIPAHRAGTILVAEPSRCTIQPWLQACGRCRKVPRMRGTFSVRPIQGHEGLGPEITWGPNPEHMPAGTTLRAVPFGERYKTSYS